MKTVQSAAILFILYLFSLLYDSLRVAVIFAIIAAFFISNLLSCKIIDNLLLVYEDTIIEFLVSLLKLL